MNRNSESDQGSRYGGAQNYDYERGYNSEQGRGWSQRGDYEQNYGGNQNQGFGRGPQWGGQNRQFEGGYGRGTRTMGRGGRSGGDYDQNYGGNRNQGGFDRGYMGGNQNQGFGRGSQWGGQNYDYDRGPGMSDWEYGGSSNQYGYSGGRNQMPQRAGEQSTWGPGNWNQESQRNWQGNSVQQGQRGRFSGRGPQDYTRSDDRIREDLNERLTQHGDIDAFHITVNVKNGEVTLEGTVEDRWQKRMAEDLAEDISGVNQVHNRLRVEQQNQGYMSGSQQVQNQQGQTQNRQGSQSGQTMNPSQSGQSESTSTQGRSTNRTKQTT
jgi:hypothetical protein